MRSLYPAAAVDINTLPNLPFTEMRDGYVIQEFKMKNV